MHLYLSGFNVYASRLTSKLSSQFTSGMLQVMFVKAKTFWTTRITQVKVPLHADAATDDPHDYDKKDFSFIGNQYTYIHTYIYPCYNLIKVIINFSTCYIFVEQYIYIYWACIQDRPTTRRNYSYMKEHD